MTSRRGLLLAAGREDAALSIELLSNQERGSGSDPDNFTIDCSDVTNDDALIIMYQNEGGSGVNSVTAAGSAMTIDVSRNNGSGATVSISRITGSSVAGNSSVTISIDKDSGGFRSSMQAFRLVNGATASVLDTASDNSTGTGSLSVDIDFSEGILFASGYYSNDQGHTFTAGTETQYDGVQNDNGSGDGATNTVPTTASHTVTYTQSGDTNTQGDSLVAVVYTPGEGGDGGGSDVTPNAVNWNNINSSVPSQPEDTNTQQITGIDTTITLSVSFPQGEDQYFVGAYSGSTGGGSLYDGASALSPGSFTFDVTNNDYITFRAQLLNSNDRIRGDTVTVRNTSDGNAILDTFTIDIED